MNRPPPIRVVLVDDHIQVHKIVARILERESEIQLVGQGSNGLEAVELCAQFKPDLVLLDVLMPRMDGVAAMRELRDQFPHIKVLVLSSYQDQESVHAMIEYGAMGYISKSTLMEDLADTIRATYHGKKVFSVEAFSNLLASPSEDRAKDKFHLTARELEVLGMMAKGLSMPEMAVKLGISHSTVKFHIGNICDKLGVQTRSEALVVATRHKLV